MNKTHFLSGLSDSHLRDKLWALFEKSEERAKGFATSHTWMKIVEVKHQKGAPGWEDLTCCTAGIHIEARCGDLGQVCHEVFHSAFHGSALHKEGDERWGDAFCDAFRYFMETEHVTDKKTWRQAMECLLKQEFDNTKKGDCVYMKYRFPASLIIKKCGSSLDDFKEMWFELCQERNAEGKDILSGYFDFCL